MSRDVVDHLDLQGRLLLDKAGSHEPRLSQGDLDLPTWDFAKRLSVSLEQLHPKLITAVYAVARRPPGHVLVDYNQNAWGQTLASIYSVRPHPRAAVSTPVTWDEVDDGLAIEDFHIRNVPDRIRALGDLWAPLLATKARFELEKYL